MLTGMKLVIPTLGLSLLMLTAVACGTTTTQEPTQTSALAPLVDSESLEGKHLVGYQGWFACPGDGSLLDNWRHWSPAQSPAPDNVSFDAWPEVEGMPAESLCDTNFILPGGQQGQLFSSYRAATVDRHFEWMAMHGIHGALLQRFSNELHHPGHLDFRDRVASNTLASAHNHGRVFAVVYDISGTDPASWASRVMNDWKHLVDDLELTDSSRYLQERGRPLVGIWGLGFSSRPGTAQEAVELLEFFHDNPEPRYRASVMGGVPTHWRTRTGDAKSDPAWTGYYQGLDVLSPWTVGRYQTLGQADQHRYQVQEPDMNWTGARGIRYLPVIFPGFSWANLTGDASTFNLIPRLGGRFYWRQVYNSVDMGATAVMTAMFDEVDEATAILPIASSAQRTPTTGRFLHLAADGATLPADWYLRLAGAAGEILQGSRPNSTSIPLDPTEPTPEVPPEPEPSLDSEVAVYRVTLAYRGLLGREPDPSGLGAFSEHLLAGESVLWLCEVLTSSAEFENQRAQLAAHEMAVELYQGILGREPDPGGLDATIGAIENGLLASRAAEMILSNEAEQNFH